MQSEYMCKVLEYLKYTLADIPFISFNMVFFYFYIFNRLILSIKHTLDIIKQRTVTIVLLHFYVYIQFGFLLLRYIIKFL